MVPKASSMKRIVSRALIASLIALSAVSSYSYSAEISAVGAIEVVDCQAQSVQVLGISFVISDTSLARLVCNSTRKSIPVYVAIGGKTDIAGLVHVSELEFFSQAYVPGTSPVFLRGEVSAVSEQTRLLSIFGALALASPEGVKVGSLVEIVGTQPVIGGPLLPYSVGILPANAAKTDSSIGSGRSRSINRAFESSIGSGVNSSIGSGAVRSISASRNSSIGSG